jgi:ligand-binding sensor domain-containing protein
MWINTLDGLYWYDPIHNRNGALHQLMPELKTLDEQFIYRDHYGYIWGRVLEKDGIGCYDTHHQRFLHFPSKGPNAPFPIEWASCCTESPQNDIWFGFGAEEKYLVCYRRATGLFEKVEPICPPGFHCAKAMHLMADLHGNLWIYADQRWFIMDMATRLVQPFGKDNGLVTNNPADICMDRDGNIWLATPYGLSRYDGQNKKLRTFYQTDGLLSNVILDVELIDTAQNILFVSTDRGLCLFEPDKIGKAPEAGPTFITSIKVSENEIQLPEDGKIEVQYSQNDLRIEFTGLNFSSNIHQWYQYSMEADGKPADWKDTGDDNFVNFLNLAPGHYVFQARTANNDGIWGSAAATLHVVIYPPWWLTWTFQLSLLAVLAVLIWWLYQRQIKRAEAREAEKARVQQQLAELEMRALRAQMNPHFVFNALNSVQNFILKNDTREASRYLTKFARLMRLILENSELPLVPLAREIELLRYYIELEALRFNQRFSVDIQIDPGLHAESIAIPGMLIQPHIENAIWHGLMHKDGPGKLLLSFEKSGDDTLICVIEDNGVGRDNASMIEKNRVKHHRSTGLSNIRNRLDLLNAELKNDISFAFQDLKDAQGNATGTRVIVRIPLVPFPSISPIKT